VRNAKLDRLFLRYREKNDLVALAQVFDQVARELLEIAAHLVHDAAEAEDLVQATFLHAIERAKHYDGERHLVPWLVGILTREARLWNRRSARALEPDRLEQHAPPEPADLAQGRELSERVLAALAGLPEPYRTVVLASLRDGRSPAEIARELDRAPGTVRVQLHRGIEMLRKRLPLGLGAGFALAALPTRGLAAIRGEIVSHAARLAGVAVPAASIGAVSVITFGGLALKKLVVVAFALVVCGVWWGARGRESVQRAPEAAAAPVEMQPIAASTVAPVVLPSEEKRSSAAGEVPNASAATSTAATGSLLLTVRWDDGSLASGVEVAIPSPSYADERTAKSDAQGEVRLRDLPPGRQFVECTRSGNGTAFEIAAGAETRAELVVPPGIDVEGRVVDDRGEPVAGADVLISHNHRGLETIVMGQSDSDGRFALRSLSKRYLGARESRHAPSEQVWLGDPQIASGRRAKVELVLPRACATVAGRVLDPDGRPVGQARVMIGGFQGSGTIGEVWEIPMRRTPDGSLRTAPQPLLVQTDASGSFVASGIELGRVPCMVNATGFPSLAAELDVRAVATERIDLRLARAVTLRGTIRRADGSPASVRVLASGANRLTVREGKCDAQGRYEINELPPGEIQFRANLGPTLHSGGDSYEQMLVAAAGETLVCDVVLPQALSIRGRALDEEGNPLARWLIRAAIPARDWDSRIEARTADDGAFTIGGCVEGSYSVELRDPEGKWEGPPSAWQADVRPGSAPIELRIRPEQKPSAIVTGRLIDGEGAPIEGGEISFWCQASRASSRTTSGSGGAFRSDPLPPGLWRPTVVAPLHPYRSLAEIELGVESKLDLGDVVLERGVLFVATIRGPSGGLPKGVVAEVFSSDGRSAHQTLDLETDGLHVLLTPGSYDLRIEAPGCGATRLPFGLEAGQPKRIEVLLERGVACALRSRAGAARTPEWVEYSVEDPTGGVVHKGFLRRAQLEAGEVETVHLAPGTWPVRATDDAKRTVTGTLVVTSLDVSPRLELAFE
jgi:RNA polymerase sigma factor (sigma-70 family)